jgi:hypothetical protein
MSEEKVEELTNLEKVWMVNMKVVGGHQFEGHSCHLVRKGNIRHIFVTCKRCGNELCFHCRQGQVLECMP